MSQIRKDDTFGIYCIGLLSSVLSLLKPKSWSSFLSNVQRQIRCNLLLTARPGSSWWDAYEIHAMWLFFASLSSVVLFQVSCDWVRVWRKVGRSERHVDGPSLCDQLSGGSFALSLSPYTPPRVSAEVRLKVDWDLVNDLQWKEDYARRRWL